MKKLIALLLFSLVSTGAHAACESGDLTVFDDFYSDANYCYDSSSVASVNVTYEGDTFQVASYNIYVEGGSPSNPTGSLQILVNASSIYVGYTLNSTISLQSKIEYTDENEQPASTSCSNCEQEITASFSQLNTNNTPKYTFTFTDASIDDTEDDAEYEMPFTLTVGSNQYEGILNGVDVSSSSFAIIGNASRVGESGNVIKVHWCFDNDSIENLAIQEISNGTFITPDCRN